MHDESVDGEESKDVVDVFEVIAMSREDGDFLWPGVLVPGGSDRLRITPSVSTAHASRRRRWDRRS